MYAEDPGNIWTFTHHSCHQTASCIGLREATFQIGGATHRTYGEFATEFAALEGEAHEDDGTPIKKSSNHDTDLAKELNTPISLLSSSGGMWAAWEEGARDARETELKFFTKYPNECAEGEIGKLVEAKWIDVNQGDAWWGGSSTNTAATHYTQISPTVEAKAQTLSDAATMGDTIKDESHDTLGVLVNEVCGAYFYAPAPRV